MKDRWIALYVENQVGVLAKISGLFHFIPIYSEKFQNQAVFQKNTENIPVGGKNGK